MDLEERTLETLPDHCENCGAALTDDEKATALELSKGPVLCKNCALEQVPLDEETGPSEEL